MIGIDDVRLISFVINALLLPTLIYVVHKVKRIDDRLAFQNGELIRLSTWKEEMEKRCRDRHEAINRALYPAAQVL
jgi:hypothetical protein